MAINRIRHIYKVLNPNQFKEVRHYELKKDLDVSAFTYKVNLSKDRGFSRADDVIYWLKQRSKDGKKWTDKNKTGLKLIGYKHVFYGDIAKFENGIYIPQHLVLFRFIDSANTLIIDYYPNYYPPITVIRDLAKQLAKEQF